MFPFTRAPVLPPGTKLWRFDVDAFRAQQPPRPDLVIDIAGVAHVARRVSEVELERFQRRRTHANPVVRTAALRRLLRAAFPFRWEYLRPGRDPVAQLMRRSAEDRGRVVVALLTYARGDAVPIEFLNTPSLFDELRSTDFMRSGAGGAL